MKRFVFSIIVTSFFPLFGLTQQITFSDYEREDTREINFEIVGKLNGNFVVYKNIRWKHIITIYDNRMQVKEKVNLDFIPEKTFNIDFVAYPDFFYMIYQYQKKGILHCTRVKMDANGQKLGEPVEMDTTSIGFFADNKIYTTIHSEDKQKIAVYKIQRKNEKLHLTTLLFDNQLKLIKKNRNSIDYDERRDILNDFYVDNDGVIVFTQGLKSGSRDYIGELSLVTKEPLADTFISRSISLDKNYVDNVELKIDNLNKHYLINSFYYKERRGNINGLFVYGFDKVNTSTVFSGFIEFSDSLRQEVKKDGQNRFAFNDFFIRQVILKKDGSYILTAEDYSTQSRGSNNPWNRYDYLYSPYFSQYNAYYYSPYYNYYRPYSNFNNTQSTRYYYNNVLVLSIDKNSKLEWSNIIRKDQVEDDNDNFLSFGTVNEGGEIHFLFADDNRYKIISDHSLTPDGQVKRNPTLKSEEKGHQFMPRFSKQVGARQIIMPCNYRGYILFAKIDF